MDGGRESRIGLQEGNGRQKLTTEQTAWLERIRDHMKENLSIDQEDFDHVPVLSRAGGWGRANKVFQGQLPDLLQQFNGAIAA